MQKKSPTSRFYSFWAAFSYSIYRCEIFRNRTKAFEKQSIDISSYSSTIPTFIEIRWIMWTLVIFTFFIDRIWWRCQSAHYLTFPAAINAEGGSSFIQAEDFHFLRFTINRNSTNVLSNERRAFTDEKNVLCRLILLPRRCMKHWKRRNVKSILPLAGTNSNSW